MKLAIAIAAACGLALLARAPSVMAETATAAAPTSGLYLQPGRLVSVEKGRRLNLVCTGHGSPTVLFESGAGGGAYDWRKVQPELAKTTTACSYDRAGYGFSDAAVDGSDANAAVKDLHQLLRRAKLRTPVVLVGHSVGGLYAELFAAKYPAEIAGLVLVDPTGRDDFKFVKQIVTPEEAEKQRTAHLNRLKTYGDCLKAAREGTAPVAPHEACAPPHVEDADLQKVLETQFAQPKYWAAFDSEMMNFYPAEHPLGSDSRTTLEVKALPLRMGSKPLILLKTPGRVPPGARGEWLRTASSGAAEALVRTSTRGKIVEVASEHYVQLDHPERVLEAIEEVVASARSGSRLGWLAPPDATAITP